MDCPFKKLVEAGSGAGGLSVDKLTVFQHPDVPTFSIAINPKERDTRSRSVRYRYRGVQKLLLDLIKVIKMGFLQEFGIENIKYIAKLEIDR